MGAIRLSPLMREVEARAMELGEACARDLEDDTAPTLVPLESWLSGPLGTAVGRGDLTAYGKGAIAVTTPEPRMIYMSDRFRCSGRFWFAVAHAVGHIILHADKGGRFIDRADAPCTLDPRLEREADLFASALLIPLSTLSEYLEKLCRPLSLTPFSAIDGLRRGEQTAIDIWRVDLLGGLAMCFGVPVSVMTRRLASVGTDDGQPVIPQTSLASLRIPNTTRPSWLLA